jgi:D-arabinose 1-dehydrogenase-like Zn-dependent alcohol dehydrogenase
VRERAVDAVEVAALLELGHAEVAGGTPRTPAGKASVCGWPSRTATIGVDLISSEINLIGNLVGSYGDLAALMALAAQQKVSPHTAKYRKVPGSNVSFRAVT